MIDAFCISLQIRAPRTLSPRRSPPLALGVGDDDRVPLGEERTEDPELDVGDDSAERGTSARDRMRRFIILTERVVGELIGDVDGRVVGLARGAIEQQRGLERRRESQEPLGSGYRPAGCRDSLIDVPARSVVSGRSEAR